MPSGARMRDRASGGTGVAIRAVLGPAVRRLRRERQWRSAGVRRLEHRSAEGFDFAVAEHATPLMRPLSGLDERLQRNKIVNLELAARSLDGIVLGPEHVLSFWREVGKPTYRRGFVDGMVLDRGRIAAGVGGGLCQLTNLLFWMTLHTDLEVVERWRHSFDVFPDASRTQPFGSGATCAWPVCDLQVRNGSDVPYRLSVGIAGGELVGGWRATAPPQHSFEVYERNHRVSHEAPGVYVRRNEIWRVVRALDGSVISDSLVTANDARMMYEPMLPSPATASVEQLGALV